MSTTDSPLAGSNASDEKLIDVQEVVDAYFGLHPDPAVDDHRVRFGTSGHRGKPTTRSFNERHVLAISQAICDYRIEEKIDGPCFVGIDTHALSRPAFETVLEVLAANEVVSMIAEDAAFTPTPAVSHAILAYNRSRISGQGDGIVITPSHNPPEHGGIKYNPPNGGPAGGTTTRWIQDRANALLRSGLNDIRRMPFSRAQQAATTHQFDFLNAYVEDLPAVIDFDVIRGAGIRMGADPLGGAGVRYWSSIAERYRLDLTLISETVDPTFRFVPLDWDGEIRMDPSSHHTMQRLLEVKDSFDIAFACDPDHDRHGIVTSGGGLLGSNHYLVVMIDYLFRNRPQWPDAAAVGKTLVSTALIDRAARRLQRTVLEMPVGFKWFADGLYSGELGFAGEESAGATFLRRDGNVWTTDKDGIVPALLSAEITARGGRDPGVLYREITEVLGDPQALRVSVKATSEQLEKLARITATDVVSRKLAGEEIESVLDRAPGNNEPVGGIKVTAANGWFAARPSGTESLYKIYAESFKDDGHLQSIADEAQSIVNTVLEG